MSFSETILAIWAGLALGGLTLIGCLAIIVAAGGFRPKIRVEIDDEERDGARSMEAVSAPLPESDPAPDRMSARYYPPSGSFYVTPEAMHDADPDALIALFRDRLDRIHRRGPWLPDAVTRPMAPVPIFVVPDGAATRVYPPRPEPLTCALCLDAIEPDADTSTGYRHVDWRYVARMHNARPA